MTIKCKKIFKWAIAGDSALKRLNGGALQCDRDRQVNAIAIAFAAAVRGFLRMQGQHRGKQW